MSSVCTVGFRRKLLGFIIVLCGFLFSVGTDHVAPCGSLGVYCDTQCVRWCAMRKARGCTVDPLTSWVPTKMCKLVL